MELLDYILQEGLTEELLSLRDSLLEEFGEDYDTSEVELYEDNGERVLHIEVVTHLHNKESLRRFAWVHRNLDPRMFITFRRSGKKVPLYRKR